MARTEPDAELAARIAVLEARLAELETMERPEDPFERLLGGFLPAESRDHLRAARKEQLLAARERRATAATDGRVRALRHSACILYSQ